MKKLMIAAALAAMVGGAFADTAYTFSVSLKTTVGKAGKSKTLTYNLGKGVVDDGMGQEVEQFWYQDATVVALIAADAQIANVKDRYFTTKKVGGKTVPALSAKAKKDMDWLRTNIVPLATTEKKDDVTAKYGIQSAKKWCDSFKVTGDEGCYRVAGTVKETAILKGDCCTDELVEVEYDKNTEAYEDVVDGFTVDSSLMQRFGGLTLPEAKKAEIFAEVEGDGIDEMYIAGQGSVGNVPDGIGITSLSGNVVGIIGAPECEFCCSDDQPAVAFDCANGTKDETLSTAAYGTFSLKYNAKVTKAL